MRVLLLATLSAVIVPALGCGGGVEIADAASRLVDARSDSAWGALVDAGAQVPPARESLASAQAPARSGAGFSNARTRTASRVKEA